jgi:biopolymer transport protein ExbB/TolQ
MTWAAALAAIVSILAAVIAFVSARRAAREARNITTLNHKVAALDRQAEQLRDDYRDLIKAIGDSSGSVLVRFRSIYAAGEVLRAHPQANEPLCAAIEQLINAYTAAATRRSEPTAYVANPIEDIRSGFRESLAEIERMRSELLG